MLLKSSSNPALNSWFQQHNHKTTSSSLQDIDLINQTLKSIKSPTISLYSPKKITKASSESDLISLSIPKRRSSLNCSVNCLISNTSVVVEDVEAEEIECMGLLFSSSGLDGNEGCSVEYLMDGTGGGGGDGGKICGGGGGGGGGDGDDGTDVYYKNMIEANPSNSLILGNYAKYLKEVRGDVLKAEEYCSRAILSNPSDGNTLSMYADLIWETQKDASRAQSYFDQAVKASPDDCYVMASYARFLWDADEEDEEEVSNMSIQAPSFFHEASQSFPIVAAS